MPAALYFCVLGVYHTIITVAEPLDMGVLLTLCQCETMGALAHLPHPGCGGEEQLETRSVLHDQLRGTLHGLQLLQPVMDKTVRGMMKATGYKTKSGLPYLWKAKSALGTDANKQWELMQQAAA